MRITVNGNFSKGVSAKDVVLYIISQVSASGGTGYFVEFAGDTFTQMSMESRMTVCNMRLKMGARGGIIAPDEVTFAYLKGKRDAPKGTDWEPTLEAWKQLKTDEDSVFDKEFSFKASDIEPMITYGTNPEWV